MLSFSGFRLEDGSPIYQQIIRYLEQGIAAGTIRDGDGLPSRRVLSALCFPLPMGSFEFGGPAEFLRPYLYDGIFYSADGLPSVLGPVLLFVSLCALAASLCQILRRDPYEE